MGQTQQIHVHVWAAIFLGGAITLFPVWMTRVFPGSVATRNVVAVAQMLMSGLLITLTGGRIETHFHVFGSLVFLSFYRDWRVLIPATIVVALDHLIRGVYWPYSVYGVLTASPLRTLEHAAWVLFENFFLVLTCRRSMSEMRAIAIRTAALEASERSSRQIFEEAPIGMALVGRDKRFKQANEKLCQMMGYSEEELMTRSPLDITHPEDLELSEKHGVVLMDGGSIPSLEKRYVRKDGEVIWATRTATSIRDESGSPRHALIMVEDISERRRAEEALRKSQQELEAAHHENQLIMDNSQDVICTVSEEGRFVTVSAACERLWGYKPAELIGRKYIELVHPGRSRVDPGVCCATARRQQGHRLRQSLHSQRRDDRRCALVGLVVRGGSHRLLCGARRHGTVANREGVARRERRSRPRQPGEKRFPLPHEPRAQDTAERHPRLRPAARTAKPE